MILTDIWTKKSHHSSGVCCLILCSFDDYYLIFKMWKYENPFGLHILLIWKEKIHFNSTINKLLSNITKQLFLFSFFMNNYGNICRVWRSRMFSSNSKTKCILITTISVTKTSYPKRRKANISSVTHNEWHGKSEFIRSGETWSMFILNT